MRSSKERTHNNPEPYYGSYYDSYHPSSSEEKSVWYYVSIIGKKIWYLVVFLLIGLIGSVFYSFTRTEMFQASSFIKLLRDDPNYLKISDVEMDSITGALDLNTKITSMYSSDLIQAVKDRLSKDQIINLLEPYTELTKRKRFVPAEYILRKNLSVKHQAKTLIVAFVFQHPNNVLAKEIADLFADEFIKLDRKRLIESSSVAADGLTQQAETTRRKLDKLLVQIAEYRKKHDLVSLSSEENIDQQELLALSNIRTQKKALLDDVKINYDLVQRYKSESKNLSELDFIASYRSVGLLLNSLATIRIEIKALSSRYKSRHPEMIQLIQRQNKIEQELQLAVQSAVVDLENNYKLAAESFKTSDQHVQNKKQEMFSLENKKVKYIQLVNKKNTLSEHLSYIESRKNEEITKVQLRKPSVVINQYASIPYSRSSPNHLLNISIGAFLGLFLGAIVIMILVLSDDTVKTHFDVEGNIGLEIMGIIPLIKKLSNHEKSVLVSNNLDNKVTESFNLIYASLKLRESSEVFNKCLLVTSTIPGEGKSFVTTNMGLTFGIHGQKTLLIDADLRLPNLAKSLNINADKGLISFFKEQISLDEIVIRDIKPNLDLITSGGKTKNASQILCSKEFAEMIMYFRQFYDRIIIDAPPMAAVSDALNILPLVDGFFYVVRSNVVNKKVASLQLAKAKSSNTPVLGGILNQVSSGNSYYYYSGNHNGDYFENENLKDTSVVR